MAAAHATANAKKREAFREIRRAFERNLPGMFEGSATIREELARIEGKVPPGATNQHWKAYETTYGEAAFVALASAAGEVTKMEGFRHRDIVDAIEDWLMDKRFISPGGGAERFCGHLWLLVAVNGSRRDGTSLKFLEYLAGQKGLDWRARWVAQAALREHREGEHLPDPGLAGWLRGTGFDRSFTEEPQLFARYHDRGGYAHSLKHHPTLVAPDLPGLARKDGRQKPKERGDERVVGQV